MLKLYSGPIKTGTRITLPESWHEKLINFSKVQSFPYEYIVTNIFKKDKENYYVCESEKKGKKIILKEFIIKYLCSQEVPDSNIGFSFTEYLPIENSSILITNMKNPSIVIPATLNVDLKLEDFNSEILATFTFRVDYINGKGFADVRYFTSGSRKSTWKFLFHEDESYMSDYEKMFRDTVIHKSFVKKSAEKLARYLEKEGAFEHASLLRKRAIVHDDSKMSCEDELHALSRIINDKTTLKDASKQLSPIKKDAIALHWKHNSHHPEHFKTPIDMSKLDIMEMCCDWHARSTQYHTDLISYVQKQQETRFHFPDWMFYEIMHYCKVLASDI